MKIDEIEYNIIKEHINNWDPAWLLEDGAPDDEYNPEINRLVNEIKDINSTKELGKHIYDLFLKMFGDNTKTKARNLYECENIANLILIGLKNINK